MFLRLIPLLLVSASLISGQSGHIHRRAKATNPHSSSKTKSSELVRLTKKLRAQGATVAMTKEKISQPFFSVAGRIIKINGEAVQVFEFATVSSADADASRVSADGTTIGTIKPSWIDTPHFFKSGKLILLYIGGNQTIVDLLRTALGNQFAGG